MKNKIQKIAFTVVAIKMKVSMNQFKNEGEGLDIKNYSVLKEIGDRKK